MQVRADTLHILRKLKDDNIKLMALPTMYEVRWCEYTHQLFDTMLSSWECVVRYFEEVSDPVGKPLGNRLLRYEHLKMMAFITDLLLVFKILQQRLQSDSLKPISMHSYVTTFKSTIAAMRSQPLLGGWEEKLEQEIQVTDGVDQDNEDEDDATEKVSWKGIELDVEYIERRSHRRIHSK